MSIQLSWPTDFQIITQNFGARPAIYAQFGLPGHEGVDIRAPMGAKVYTCAPGVVKGVYKNYDQPYGLNVRVTHAGGWETIYAHLKSSVVTVGQQVQRRQQIAFADNSGTNTSASHLHLTLKKQGATARGETRFPYDIVDPTPYLLPLNAQVVPTRHMPDHPLRGLHDGAAWMLQNGARGWAVEVLYCNGDFNPRSLDFTRHAAAGVRVIVRLNWSWAAADGGQGTFPRKAEYDRFAEWCYRTIRASRGVWGWVVGNEPNRAAERPDPNVPITPEDVTYLHNQVWYHARKEDRISPPALDPTNVETGDPREYFRSVLANIHGAEFFALHAYSYGVGQAVESSERFADHPMTWQFHSFRMWEPFASVLYTFQKDGQFPYRALPLIITEANHLTLNDMQTNGWEESATDWVRAAHQYIAAWNSGPGEQFVHGVCLYRYEGDAWAIKEREGILHTLK